MGHPGGIWIGGKAIELEEQALESVLKYALVPPDQWKSAAFNSGDMGEVLSMADDLSVEIVIAMAKDSLKHAFADAKELADNIALRKGVIAAMRAICAGDIDGDYVEAVDGVPPTLGYLGNLEALFAPGNKTGKSILTKQLPFVPPDDAWEHIAKAETWAGFRFMQNPDVPLSTALQAITPFRGECAGALQLAIMLGCLNSYGSEKLDGLVASHGPAFVGAWHLPAGKDAKRTNTLATSFFAQTVDIPSDYERGSVIAVPGDYLYFQNKDDYPDLAKTGGWQGENCFYMGQDALGHPHYSGLGLAWKTEFAFRMFLTNAYINDVNTAYLTAMRNGKKPKTDLQIVEHPQKQVRFVARALLRFPDKDSGKPPSFRLPQSGAYPFDDAQILAALDKLGFKKVAPDEFEATQIKLGSLMKTLSIGDQEFFQAPSAPLGGAALQVQMNQWHLVVDPVNPDIVHPDADDLVHAHAARRL